VPRTPPKFTWLERRWSYGSEHERSNLPRSVHTVRLTRACGLVECLLGGCSHSQSLARRSGPTATLEARATRSLAGPHGSRGRPTSSRLGRGNHSGSGTSSPRCRGCVQPDPESRGVPPGTPRRGPRARGRIRRGVNYESCCVRLGRDGNARHNLRWSTATQHFECRMRSFVRTS